MAIDWAKLFSKHKGQWVALQDDERTVIASAPTLKEVRLAANKKGFSNPIVAKMPQNLDAFVG